MTCKVRRPGETRKPNSQVTAPLGYRIGHDGDMPYMPRDGFYSGEAEWAFILKAQKNVISAAQAHALGMPHDAIRAKVKSGRWQAVYHGVYATFTGELPREARLWAVVLRCGRSAVLSHETAAEIHRFAPSLTDKIHVTVPGGSNPARSTSLRGVVVHRSLAPEDHSAGMARGRTD
jgi:hypothetical protein